jgi:hypothetical protein
MLMVPPMAVTDAVLVSTNVDEDEYAEWSSGATYSKGGRVQVVDADYHQVFESAAAGNINHDPVTDDAEQYWLKVGATNPWRMFDNRRSSVTTNPDSIAVTVRADGLIDTVTVLGATASSLHIVMTDDVEGVVFDETFDLNDNSGVIDAYTYGYGPLVRIADKAIIDLPPYPDALIAVTLSAPGETVNIATLAFGQQIDLGGTPWGASVGIVDTSVKARTDFGDSILVERPFYKTGEYSVWVASSRISWLQAQLAQYRAIPCIWIGDPDVGVTIGLGTFEDMSQAIQEYDVSLLTLRIGMLT